MHENEFKNAALSDGCMYPMLRNSASGPEFGLPGRISAGFYSGELQTSSRIEIGHLHRESDPKANWISAVGIANITSKMIHSRGGVRPPGLIFSGVQAFFLGSVLSCKLDSRDAPEDIPKAICKFTASSLLGVNPPSGCRE